MASATLSGGAPPDKPVPLTAIVCGLPVPLLTTTTLALRAPAIAGENVMLNAHDAPGATVAQSAIRLLATVTLPARKILMALPFWPSPPSFAATRSMRLPMTSVPSSRRSEVHT